MPAEDILFLFVEGHEWNGGSTWAMGTPWPLFQDGECLCDFAGKDKRRLDAFYFKL